MMKTIASLFGAILLTTGLAAVAADAKQGGTMAMDMDMSTMDTNKDGMISKEEFMKHHEAMWEKMKKNKSGMVDLKDMGNMMHGGMMHGGMMKDEKAMKGDKMMMDDKMKDSMKK